MAGSSDDRGRSRPPRGEGGGAGASGPDAPVEEELGVEQLERAILHGLEARGRFADRPWREVEEMLRESWRAMAERPSWERIRTAVRVGYEGGRADEGALTMPAREALRRVKRHTAGGSTLGGGTVAPRPRLGDTEPGGERS